MHYKFYTSIMAFIALLITPTTNILAESKISFAVEGEQLTLEIPKNWKLAWMDGDPKGGFVAEYIPESENIKSWKTGYLAIQRYKNPSEETLAAVADEKASLAEIALNEHIHEAKISCQGTHKEMSRRTNTFNAAFFAVGGGFCEKYGSAAPFGEGAFVAFVEGQNFFFRIQYGWRPQSEEEFNEKLPWRINGDKAIKYLDSIKSAKLCGGDAQPKCNPNLP